jgi:hypothetical protein
MKAAFQIWLRLGPRAKSDGIYIVSCLWHRPQLPGDGHWIEGRSRLFPTPAERLEIESALVLRDLSGVSPLYQHS